MHDPRSQNDPAKHKFPFGFETYWQCVLRFGFPFVVVYYGINYAAFRLASLHHPSRYHWGHAILSACVAMLAASAIWWLIMREIGAKRGKSK